MFTFIISSSTDAVIMTASKSCPSRSRHSQQLQISHGIKVMLVAVLAASSPRTGVPAAPPAGRASGRGMCTARYSSSSPEPSPDSQTTSARGPSRRRRSVASWSPAQLTGTALLLLSLFLIFVFVLMGWAILPNALRPFQDLLCSPEFRYYQDENMPIKFCSEAYFFRLEVL